MIRPEAVCCEYRSYHKCTMVLLSPEVINGLIRTSYLDKTFFTEHLGGDSEAVYSAKWFCRFDLLTHLDNVVPLSLLDDYLRSMV